MTDKGEAAAAKRKELKTSRGMMERMLVEDGVLTTKADAPPKKRGRPAGSKNKSPSRRASIADPKPIDATIDDINKTTYSRQLKKMAKLFPEYRDSIVQFSPDSHTGEDCKRLYETCKSNIECTNEAIYAPDDMLIYPQMAEEALCGLAEASHPDSYFHNLVALRGLTNEIGKDPRLQDDIKLLAIEMPMGPATTPGWRIFKAFVLTAGKLLGQHKLGLAPQPKTKSTSQAQAPAMSSFVGL